MNESTTTGSEPADTRRVAATAGLPGDRQVTGAAVLGAGRRSPDRWAASRDGDMPVAASPAGVRVDGRISTGTRP